MGKKIKSGKNVIDEFFAEICNIPNVDLNAVDVLIELYSQGRLTDKNVQNAMDEILKQEINLIEKKDE